MVNIQKLMWWIHISEFTSLDPSRNHCFRVMLRWCSIEHPWTIYLLWFATNKKLLSVDDDLLVGSIPTLPTSCYRSSWKGESLYLHTDNDPAAFGLYNSSGYVVRKQEEAVGAETWEYPKALAWAAQTKDIQRATKFSVIRKSWDVLGYVLGFYISGLSFGLKVPVLKIVRLCNRWLRDENIRLNYGFENGSNVICQKSTMLCFKFSIDTTSLKKM